MPKDDKAPKGAPKPRGADGKFVPKPAPAPAPAPTPAPAPAPVAMAAAAAACAVAADADAQGICGGGGVSGGTGLSRSAWSTDRLQLRRSS